MRMCGRCMIVFLAEYVHHRIEGSGVEVVASVASQSRTILLGTRRPSAHDGGLTGGTELPTELIVLAFKHAGYRLKYVALEGIAMPITKEHLSGLNDGVHVGSSSLHSSDISETCPHIVQELDLQNSRTHELAGRPEDVAARCLLGAAQLPGAPHTIAPPFGRHSRPRVPQRPSRENLALYDNVGV